MVKEQEMTTLIDILASKKTARVASLSELDDDPFGRTRRSTYQSFAEAQRREGMRAERSPLVIWAKHHLHPNTEASESKLSPSTCDG
jgi:hypothetical protein